MIRRAIGFRKPCELHLSNESWCFLLRDKTLVLETFTAGFVLGASNGDDAGRVMSVGRPPGAAFGDGAAMA